jgi:DNA polymerase III subunit beta
MKFLCDKFRLESVLAPILAAIPSKDGPKTSLKSVHIAAGESSLILRSSNMELSIETSLDAVKVEEGGECLVPARPFAALLREITDPTVHIEVKDDCLSIPTSSGRFDIVTGDPVEFPDISFVSDGTVVQVPIEQMHELFSTTEFACAREATKYAMNGVMFQVKDQTLTFVATDGRRLAINSHPLDVAPNIEIDALLPHRSFGSTLKALLSMTGSSVHIDSAHTDRANSDEGKGGARTGALVSVSFNEGSVCFSIADARISMQKIMGTFPDFNNVIPQDISTTVEFNKSLLESNLRRAAVMTEAINPAIKITLEAGQCRIESDAVGVGSADTSMDVDMSGPGGMAIFNPHYIFDAIKVAQVDPIRFEFKDGNTPGKFLLGEQFIYILMPITGIK